MKDDGTSHLSNPIFIFASGQRCGSTLIQRLLNSHNEILIWGEQHGFFNGFLKEYQRLLDWEREYKHHRETYLRNGYDNFVANMIPESQKIEEASRSFIEQLFGEPAKELGKTRWGFKEVRYDSTVASFLKRLFPDSVIIHLTRNVIDCFISLKHWENAPGPWTRSWTEIFLKDWQRINSSFLLVDDKLQKYISVKYEELVNNWEKTVMEICSIIDISIEELDLKVIHRRLHREGAKGSMARPHISRRSLSYPERDLLTRPPIIDISRSLNYELDFEKG